ncbi:hypothetical protein N9061_01530 [bacterium]|nr:hypothetical protein [Mariniblastus sp.]MDB4483801.1 hypothetical protein [bacterium]
MVLAFLVFRTDLINLLSIHHEHFEVQPALNRVAKNKPFRVWISRMRAGAMKSSFTRLTIVGGLLLLISQAGCNLSSKKAQSSLPGMPGGSTYSANYRPSGQSMYGSQAFSEVGDNANRGLVGDVYALPPGFTGTALTSNQPAAQSC